jgi:hypothetical protein
MSGTGKPLLAADCTLARVGGVSAHGSFSSSSAMSPLIDPSVAATNSPTNADIVRIESVATRSQTHTDITNVSAAADGF